MCDSETTDHGPVGQDVRIRWTAIGPGAVRQLADCALHGQRLAAKPKRVAP